VATVSDDDQAPGWDAIDSVLKPLYGAQKPKHWAAAPHWALGGKNPLDGVSAYEASNPPHWHVVSYGRSGMSARERRTVMESLAAIPPEDERLVLATGRYIGEGFDDARLDTLFLALPVSWKGTLVQYTGRLHRLHPGKSEVRIYDYVDREVLMLSRMFEKRLRGYRAIGYVPDDMRSGSVEATTDIAPEEDVDLDA
jgi:hypothetical protein